MPDSRVRRWMPAYGPNGSCCYETENGDYVLARDYDDLAAASPDERLREALTADAIAAAVMEWDRWPCRATTDKRPAMRAAIAAALDTAALAAADREAPDEETR